jgi:hypothetical protein
VYFSNIQRGKEATLEGVIDLLVSSQSQIVSFTGSTFQSVARLIGEVSLFAELVKPAPISYAAVGDVKGMLQAGRLPLGQLLGVCEELVANDRTIDALSLLLEALRKGSGNESVRHLIQSGCVFDTNQQISECDGLFSRGFGDQP